MPPAGVRERLPSFALAPASTLARRGGALRQLLRRGGVVALPTESSYGLGCDPRDAEAVRTIYRLKGRQPDKALPVVAADLSQLAELGIEVDSPPVRVLEKLWPAALTAVLPIRRPLPATAGSRTLAVRIPDHGLLRQWLRFLGPLTATSANRSGAPPILDPRQLSAEWGEAGDATSLAILDGGVLDGGPPSTLISWLEAAPRVLRPGRFPPENLRALVPTTVGSEVRDSL